MKKLYQLILGLGYLCWICLPEYSFAQCGNGNFKVLHYTETSGFNHNTRSQSLSMFQAIGSANGFTVTNDQSGAEFNSVANLQQYAVVIFSNTSGNNILNATQRANFEAYIQGGGSYIGIHAASDTYRHSSANGGSRGTWDWYAENVAGCSVQQSPNHTSQNHNNNMTHRYFGHPTLAGLPNPWNKTEEYYYWENGYLNPTFTEVLRVNQTGGASYDAARMTTHVKELQWGGRAFYTSLGHAQSNFTSDQNFRTLLANAVNWTAAPNAGGGGAGLILTANISDATCDLNNGAIDLSVSGGSGTYSYSWSNGENSQDISNLAQGSYDVLVDDGNGCTERDTFVVVNVSSKPLLTLNIDQEISCFAANDGAISSTVLGNGAPYSYIWNTGATSADLTGLGAGNYRLIVTSLANCKDTADVSLSEPAALQLNLQIQSNPSCGNPIGGEILGQANGGRGNLSYLWNTAATTNLISGLDSGKFVLTVTDSALCSIKDSVQLSYSSFGLTLTETESIDCFGGNEGEITAGLSGGNAPFTYSWNNGQTTAVASNLSAGWQVLSVTDNDGCVELDSLFLNQPDSLQPGLMIVQNIDCNGGNNGVLSASPSGGTIPYTYLWNNSVGSDSLKNLDTGLYRLEILDAKGCSAVDSVRLDQGDSLSIQFQISQEISCNGLSDGALLATASGGIAPYTYNWANGQNTALANGLGFGWQAVEVQDANGCLVQDSILLLEPTSVNASLNLVREVSCFGGIDGQMSVSISGGNPPYTYNWSSGATDSIANNLASGMQVLEVRDSSNCLWTDSLLMPEPSALQLTPQVLQAASCNGAANGEAKISARGGVMPYSFLWSSGETDSVASGLVAGIYQVVVTDANGCQDSVDVTVNNNIPWTLNMLQTEEVDCFGDSSGGLRVEVQNGNGFEPFSFLWSNGATDSSLANLPEGSYSVTVTDKDACQQSSSFQLQAPDSIAILLSLQTPISCFGANDGVLAASVSGGTAPFTYNWSNGQTASTNNQVAAGMMILTVTDAKGCVQIDSIQVNEPVAISINFQLQTAISCNGFSDGSLLATASGGSAPYTYTWANGQNTALASGLAFGWQAVEVQDANGCQVQDSILLLEPSAINASLNLVQEVSCFGQMDGQMSVSVSGGNPPYTYNWSSGATDSIANNLSAGMQILEIRDSNNCLWTDSLLMPEPTALVLTPQIIQAASCNGVANGEAKVSVSGANMPYTFLWSSGQTDSLATGLMAGIYRVIVSDANGCQDSIDVNVNNNIPWSLNLIQTSDIDCFGDSTGGLSVEILNGIGSEPYSFLWSNGATDSSLINLPAASYTVTVTDKDACQASVSINLQEPDSLNLQLNIQSAISCFGANDGIVNAILSGGTTPYTYAWSNGQSGATNNPAGTGMLSLTVTDANGCTKTDSILLSEPTALAINFQIQTPISCNGLTDGVVEATPIGGTLPYTYIWANGQNTSTSSSLGVGWQVLQIQDGGGCTFTDSIFLSQPSALNVVLSETSSISCNGALDGELLATTSGSQAPYTYQWSNNVSTPLNSNLGAGLYSVIVQDANLCLDTLTYTLNQPDSIRIDLQLTQSILCAGDGDAVLNATVNGGTGPYSFSWSGGEITSFLANLGPGTYSVQVDDANACVDSSSFVVTQPDSLDLSITGLENVSCAGGMDGSASLIVSGGSPAYSYLWGNGANTPTVNNLSAGLQNVRIFDTNGCTDSLQFLVTENPPIVASIMVDQEISCFGGNDAILSLTASGGIGNLTYQWSNGNTTQTAVGFSAGIASVLITDSLGCNINLTQNLANPPALQSQLILQQALSCPGVSDASLLIRPAGGMGPYTIQWNTGSTDSLISNLSAGLYSVLVTDSKGCTENLDTLIQAPRVINSTLSLSQAISCNGAMDANIDLDISGGSPTFSFLWQDGNTNQNRIGVGAGTYRVEIRDANNCLQRDTLIVSEPDLLTAQLNLIDSASCAGAQDAIVEAMATGGTGNYTYLWSNGETGVRAENLSAGFQRLEIRDANNCVFIDSLLVSEPSPLINTFSILDPISCNGAADGSIMANIAGGTTPYEYRWNSQLDDSVANNLSAQQYVLEVLDARGCSLMDSILLNQPDELLLRLSLLQDASCETATDGSALAEVSGGLSPYQVTWSNGSSLDSLLGVGSGMYGVLVQDSLGCTIEDSIQVGENLSWTAEVFLLDSISCFGGSNGKAAVRLDVPVAGFSFLWDNGETNDTAMLLPAGIQNVTVRDSFACERSLSVEIPQPDSLDIFVSIIFTEPGQSNGAISVDSIANGNAPFSFLWSTGATTNRIGNLPAGQYDLQLIDSEGCESFRTYSIDTTVFEWENFEAIADFARNRVQLLWSVRREINNKEFTIERSLDNILFEQHMEIPSAGDFIGLRSYEAFDLTPLPNKSFYRIKQSFFNGRFSYFSQTREVLFWDFSPGFLIAYPVPMMQGEDLNVELEMKDDSETTLFIINTLNQEVHQQVIENPSERQSLILPTSGFSAGLYYILVNNATERYSFSFQIEG
ncbi:MAG: ThuA domain-containing protein [Bacteroidota bacterium]